MDNGSVNFGGGAPAEDGGAAGAGVPGENMREGPQERISEAAREAAVEAIAQGARRIQAARAVETKAGSKRGKVAKKLGDVLQTPIAGDLLTTVVARATKVDQQIRKAAVAELDAVDPLSPAALEFLGIQAGPSANDATYANNNTSDEEDDNTPNLLAA